MLCPATNFFREAKRIGIVPWHDDGDESSGDEKHMEPMKKKIRATSGMNSPRALAEHITGSATTCPDEKNPFTPLPSVWEISVDTALGFSVRVKPPSTTAGRILQHCKARGWETSDQKQPQPDCFN